jgi:CubicO group peptidase (beta-lactamase class C family)
MQTMELDRRRMLGGITAAALTAAAGPAWGRTAAAGLGNLQSLIDSYVAAGRVPGAVVALVRPGRFRPAYLFAGKTAFDGGVAVTPDTLWRIYSMTKPITGMAVMQQVAGGKLGLDQPIAEIMPEFREMRVLIDPAKGLESRPAATPILLRHLLTHTAGLSYSIIGNGPLEKEYRRLGLQPGTGASGLRPGDGALPDLQGFALRLAGLPLLSEPGTAWRYSVGLDLAGALLERLTGEGFDAVLRAQLFGPLGMASTRFSVASADLRRLSSNYAWVDRSGKPMDTPVLIDGPARSDWMGPQRLLSGGGGLLSSARDYARFGQMLLNDGMFDGRPVMPPGSARHGMSNLLPPGVFYRGDGDNGFGAGGQVELFDTLAKPDGASVGSYGWGGAAGTRFVVDPVRRVAVVVMLQYLPGERFPLHADLRGALNRDLARPGVEGPYGASAGFDPKA